MKFLIYENNKMAFAYASHFRIAIFPLFIYLFIYLSIHLFIYLFFRITRYNVTAASKPWFVPGFVEVTNANGSIMEALIPK